MFENIFDLSPVRDLADWYFLFYMAISLFLFWGAKRLNGLLTGYRIDRQLTQRDNKAIGVSFMGFLFAVGLIISGVLTSPVPHSLWNVVDNSLNGDVLLTESIGEGDLVDLGESEEAFVDSDLGEGGVEDGEMLSFMVNTAMADFVNTVLWSLIGCALLLASRVVNDKVILPKFSNENELIQEENIAVGVVQAASYISTALIVRATLGVEATPNLGWEVLRVILWFAVSQVLLLAYAVFYQKFTSFDMHAQLKDKNAAVGISFGGDLVAIAILVKFYLMQYDSLLGLLIWTILAAVLLWLNRLVIDRVMLPKSGLDEEIGRDRNWGVALIEASIAISAGLIIAGSAF